MDQRGLSVHSMASSSTDPKAAARPAAAARASESCRGGEEGISGKNSREGRGQPAEEKLKRSSCHTYLWGDNQRGALSGGGWSLNQHAA